MSQLAQGLELGHDLRRLLHSWHAPEDLRDVAELAGERTAARGLDAHRAIPAHLEQIESRDGRLVQRRSRAHGADDPRGLRPRLDRREQRVDPPLGLPEKQAVRIVEALRRRRARRTSQHGPSPELPCPRQDLVDRWLLHEHPTREHHVGPAQIVLPQRRHVHVDEAHLPAARQQSRHGDQPERRESRAPVDERQAVLKPPVCRRELRVDEQYPHRGGPHADRMPGRAGKRRARKWDRAQRNPRGAAHFA